MKGGRSKKCIGEKELLLIDPLLLLKMELTVAKVLRLIHDHAECHLAYGNESEIVQNVFTSISKSIDC